MNADGLKQTEAATRLAQFGPNEPVPAGGRQGLRTLFRAILNPLSVILLVAAVISAVLGEGASAAVIAFVVTLSTVIQYFQTARSDRAIRQLREQIALTATVKREGVWLELPRRLVVPGDCIRLSAGDLVPADARLFEARDLHVHEAALTGESIPVEKQIIDSGKDESQNTIYFGTSIVSGAATAIVTATGSSTAFGHLTARLAATPPDTEFDRGIRHFGFFITQMVFALVGFVFLVCAVRQRDAFESLLFALALAVGLTPELLPMIVAVTLARGAVRMAKRHVIVKHLKAIQNLGSIDVLCTDKTGTLTLGEMSFERGVDCNGEPCDRVYLLAYLNSGNETGIRSPFDSAILAKAVPPGVEDYRKRDEIPFDFERRRLSVILDGPGGPMLIAKGSPESILSVCELTKAERDKCLELTATYGREGARVLAIGSKRIEKRERYTTGDESELTLEGFLTFSDPVREDARHAIALLKRDGVRVVMISGDSGTVAGAVARQVGLSAERVVTGTEIDRLTDPALGAVAEQVAVFARISPIQKSRILAALKSRGHAVGFLGDGINDAPSLHRSDVGVSVSTAVDIAREAADVILLRPGLRILHAGIIEGRRAFGNVTKYLLMGTSSNFGNMLSMAAATVFLPFLPMRPAQVLINNLLYDIAQLPIPTDHIDPVFARKPQRWNIAEIRRFMFIAGAISSLFDLITFAILLLMLHAIEAQFQTAWFIESLLTQTLVVLVIRTAGKPWRPPPSRWLTATVLGVCGLTLVLPCTSVAEPIGFTPLPAVYLAAIAGLVTSYLGAMSLVKRLFFSRPEND